MATLTLGAEPLSRALSVPRKMVGAIMNGTEIRVTAVWKKRATDETQMRTVNSANGGRRVGACAYSLIQCRACC
jgi:hypothetical protein